MTMNAFIRFMGTFLPKGALDRFEFTTTAADREAARERMLEAFLAIENGPGFGAFVRAN